MMDLSKFDAKVLKILQTHAEKTGNQAFTADEARQMCEDANLEYSKYAPGLIYSSLMILEERCYIEDVGYNYVKQSNLYALTCKGLSFKIVL